MSHLMTDVCKLIGIKKLNTTSHHPQCDGMVERLNRTLKTMLRKYAAEFSTQWDKYLPGALWAYRNLPHDSTGEKPSFLLYRIDCRTPTEAALLPTHVMEPTEVSDYREELVLSLSTAWRIATEAIRTAQANYKTAYDRRSRDIMCQVGDWILIRFPQDETGRMRKLSRPWHGPYRVVDKSEPDITAVKVYAPQDGQIKVHQSRVVHCPCELPAGFYWYGGRRSSPGRPPRWVDKLLQGTIAPTASRSEDEPECNMEEVNEESFTLGGQDVGRGEDKEECNPADTISERNQHQNWERDQVPDVSQDRSTRDPAVEDTPQRNEKPPVIKTKKGAPKKKSTDSASSSETAIQRSENRSGLRVKTVPPARLMSVYTRLEPL